MRVVVQSDPFDPGAETNAFTSAQSASGAVVTFSGIVRDVTGGLDAMEIEHYPGMTERALTDIANEAVRRWSLEDALVIHRHGTLKVGEQNVKQLLKAADMLAIGAVETACFNFLKSNMVR